MKMPTHLKTLWTSISVLALSFSCVSCSTWKEVVEKDPLSNRAWWKGDGIEGNRKIVINLSTQRIQYFKGDTLVGVSPISSGRENHITVTGTYHIMEKDLNHRSSIYGSYADKEGNMVQGDVDSRKDPCPAGAVFIGASMRYFMRVVGGIGMHEGYLPGYPASHGCIRLPTKMAAIIFEETPHGTPVQIIGESSLAANEPEVPLHVGKIEDSPAPMAEPSPVLNAKVSNTVKIVASPATKAVDSQLPVPKLLVRRAIVEAPKAAAAGSMRSFFKWSRKPPPGTTLYLE